jgi:hypothetical protein
MKATDIQTGEDLGPGEHRGTVETHKMLMDLFNPRRTESSRARAERLGLLRDEDTSIRGKLGIRGRAR